MFRQVLRRLYRSSWVLPGTVSLFSFGCQRGPEVRFADPSQLLARIEQGTACSRGVVGDAHIEVAGPFAHYKGKLMYKAEAPNHLRFDLYSDFGVTLAAVASNESELSFFDLKSGTVEKGPPNSCSLARFTQVQVPPFALIELLRGRAPVLSHHPDDAKIRFSNSWFSGGHYVISIVGDQHSEETIWVEIPESDWLLPLEQQRTRLKRVVVRQAGSLSYAVDLSDYRPATRASLEPSLEEREMGLASYQPSGPICNAELPHTLTFDVGHGGHELIIRAQELKHNPPHFPDSFALVVPSGTRSLQNSCPR